ncbi:serine/threonine protein kinase, CMGC, dual-specificity [Teratosphaeriaceae sp. CCFEE 6253]|nr:serine/threonine protein kinase, CMGC, dual-specificity [Teratosphaeriaceae sp. CCFEE 6253]
MPISTPTSQRGGPMMPRPSDELDDRRETPIRTPEPVSRRHAKTPGTPMTASKATFFFRRQDQDVAMGMGGGTEKLRSASSHYALRDLQRGQEGLGAGFGGLGGDMETEHDVNGTRFFDDSDGETPAVDGIGAGGGVPISNGIVNAKHRVAITPFASGSLPKHSGEFARLRGRPSGEYSDDYDLGTYESMMLMGTLGKTGARPKTSGPGIPGGKMVGMEGVGSGEEVSQGSAAEVQGKKEGGRLIRKLSLGWRRSSSKSAHHAENKASPGGFESAPPPAEKMPAAKLQKRVSEMPPQRLPASASAQWSGEGGLLGSTSARPSLENARRKSQMPGQGNGQLGEHDPTPSFSMLGGAKTRALHSEQPQPVQPVAAATRSSSWAASTFGSLSINHHNNASQQVPATGPIGKPSVVPARHKLTASTISALVKDKDDLAADDEMRRLSQKRKDVDSAARESEALKVRAVPRSSVKPERVLQDRHGVLNIYERGEIVDYADQGVYFTGTKSAKKIIGSLSPSPTSDREKDKDAAAKAGNYGYDDERGDYNIVLGDHLSYRYEVVDLLGKGSFGQVVRCVDHKLGGVVAVKIIRNKKRFHQQALVEVGILGRLGEWDPDGAHATLSIMTSFYFRSHLCIVTPCLSINLYELTRAHNFAGFPIQLLRRFARQLLACLVLLQTKRIIHCDLKPENILLCEARKADVRVIDFGSSCREEEKVYTYIQSRFYRSPEVILGSTYGLGIDMWSLGCILAELWTGSPLFPGENEQEQLACIMEVFGPPDRQLVERCTRKKLFFDSVGKPRVTVSSKGRRRRPSSKTLQQALKTDDEAFVDFVARCLRWDPERRMKPSEAVGHPFVTGLPFHQRPGIPEEARRAARVRSSATVAVPIVSGPGASSPVKRKEGNAFAVQAATTPAKERRQLPETPQTAVRTGNTNTTTINTNGVSHGSPSKAMPANNNSRRHSTAVGHPGMAVAGSKRASNGAVLGHAAGVNVGMGPAAGTGQQRLASMGTLGGGGNLAQMAARESMGGGAAAGRWRS